MTETPTRMWRPTYTVELLADPESDAGTVHTVRIMHGDQLRAELEAGRNMIDAAAQPFALTSLWVWAAMTRQHLTDLPWQEWKHLVACLERVAPPADTTPREGGLDPTRPGAPTPSP